MEDIMEHQRYPTGRYERPERYTQPLLNEWIGNIEALPSWLDVCIENLDAAQLQAPYREGGWTIQQVIHHVADSHMNAYIRLKLTLTEDNPTVKPYEEKLWAELADVQAVPVNISITLLHALHRRMVAQLRSLAPGELDRTYYHPDMKRNVPIWELVALYSWHSRHHMSQIRSLRERMNWQ